MAASGEVRTAINVRLCRREELPDVVRLYNSAFIDSEFQARFMPGRRAYPHEHYSTTLHRFRNRFAQPDMLMLVAEDSEGRIVGHATYETIGESAVTTRWSERESWWSSLERSLLRVEELYIQYVINHCYDFDLMLKFRKISSNFYNKVPPHLHLVIVAVAPDQQGKGIGKQLIQWGLDLAETNQLPIVLESSKYAKPIYDAVGFKTYAKMNLDHEREGKLDVPVMLWEPSALKGKVLEEDGVGGWKLKRAAEA